MTMKLITGLVAILLIQPSIAFAAANCQHSHSWQCQGHQANANQGSQTGSGIASGGKTPDQGQTNTPLGGGSTSSVPMMTLQPATQITPMVALQPATTIVKPPQPVIAVPPQPQVVAPPKVPILAPSMVPPQPQVVAPPKVPILAPSMVPPQPQVVAPPKVPILAPSMVPPQPQVVAPPQQVYMVPSKVVTGYAAVPPKPLIKAPPLIPPKQPPVQVYALPPKTFSGQGQVPVPQVVKVPPRPSTQAPPRQVYPNPNPVVVGFGQVPQPQVTSAPAQGTGTQGQTTAQQTGGTGPGLATNQPSHLLVNNRVGQFSAGQQLLKSDYGKEVVEPGIMNSKVTLYRSHDVREVVFEDTIPMDATGFHLNFVGIREPVFTVSSRELPQAQPAPEVQAQAGEEAKTFVFFFDYASAATHPEQAGLYAEIAEEYVATGKRVILVSETDGFGSYEYNTALATHRGDTIAAALRERGVKAEDIELHLLVRYGRSEPSSNDSHRLSSGERIAWVHFE
jgi:hypothetical protein